jgi:hypothetical protein
MKVFNSNSPELVLNEGILLSTFPADGNRFPQAHLNQEFAGRFDVFAHHIARGSEGDLRTLYLGIVVHNPGSEPVNVDILQAASYLSQPDAPFIDLPPVVNNDRGDVYSGPGDRAASDLLRGRRQADFPAVVVVPAGESRMLLNVPIPVKTLTPPLNGRSTMMRLRSTGPVYLASLAQFAQTDAAGAERAPTLEEWQTLLQTSDLVTPRDRTPTPLDQTSGGVIYGRVSGVSQGGEWRGTLTDPGQRTLRIPPSGQAYSYGLATLQRGTLGTAQVQTATMLARYPDTAYAAHGNYAVQYSLRLPLVNTSDRPQTVVLTVETPLKQDDTADGLRFFQPLPKQTFFRGTVRFRYTDDDGLPRTHYFHLVQRRGQAGEPLVTLNLPAGDRRLVLFDLIYPPDATPPQVLTLQTR